MTLNHSDTFSAIPQEIGLFKYYLGEVSRQFLEVMLIILGEDPVTGKQSVGDFFSWLHLSEFTLGGKQTSITVEVEYLFTFLLLYFLKQEENLDSLMEVTSIVVRLSTSDSAKTFFRDDEAKLLVSKQYIHVLMKL